MTQAFEDANSKLIDVVTVADEDRVRQPIAVSDISVYICSIHIRCLIQKQIQRTTE